MFLTLILQYLNELVKSKVRYFSAPKSFHTVKVQGFNRDRIKPFTEIGGKFPMKVFALIRNFSIKRQSVGIPLALPLVEILMYLPHIVKQVTKTYRIRLIVYFIFIGFHGISSIRHLSLTTGRRTRGFLATTPVMSVNLIQQC